MLKNILLFVLGISISYTATAQQMGCDGSRYFDSTFSVDTTMNVIFGNSTTIGGTNADLKMEIFEPMNDTLAQRPVVIVAFGGSFINGDRTDMYQLCDYYARRGYIAATIDYRLYDGSFFPTPDSAMMTDEVMKAVSDMKAAVRFFREDAATNNTYKVDTNFIFVGGVSSGSITASHLAYLDSTDVIEPYVQTILQNNGGWTGNSSTNTQYSSEVSGVLNFSGALRDADYIDANDVPLFSVHDDGDNVVPYRRGSASVASIPIITIEGSGLMHPRALAVGLSSSIIVIPNSSAHVSYFSGSGAVTWRDSISIASLNFMQNIICPLISTTTTIATQTTTATVYPNPSNSDVTLSLSNVPMTYSLRIFDQMGRIVYQKTSLTEQQLQISKDNFSAGIYHLYIQFDSPNIAPVRSKLVFY